MPRRERLAQKGIHEDARRLRSMPRGRGGGVAPHHLLGQFHSDAEIAAPVQGAMILANATPNWDILLHPTATGYALVTDATDVAWDIDPEWRGRHSWHDGVGVTAYIDEDGSADFDGHVAIGDGATVNAAYALHIAEAFTDVAGTVVSGYGRLDFDPGASFDTTAMGVYGRILIGTAQARTGGALSGVRGYVNVDNAIAASDLVVYGVSASVDIEDATSSIAVGVNAQVPIVDTGTIASASGVRISDGAVGAGEKTSNYGLYIDAITNGVANRAIYSATGDWELDVGDLRLDSSYGIIHADGVADGQILVANGTRYVPGDLSDVTGGDAQFVTMAASGTLANERVLTAGDGIALTDGGAGGNATVAVDLVAAWSGLEFSGGDLRVDLDAAYTWTGDHIFTSANGIEIDVATGDPIITWDTQGADKFTAGVDDSDSDKFKINSGSALADPSDFELDSSGNVEIGGDFNLLTGKGIIHADDGGAGNILVSDGTRFVPANPAASLPIAPGARGDIIRAEAGPVWNNYSANTLGAVLIGNGTDIISDTTPTLVDVLTFDDGAGNSPGVRFVGGSNDDAGTIYLQDNAVAGKSDVAVQLCADDEDAKFLFKSNSFATVAWVDATGDALFVDVQTDDLTITTGHGIIHADSVAAGQVLLANGTRYIPAAANTNVPVAPGAQGHILRAEAGPVWASYAAATLGAVLIGDGTDIISDTTPTLVGDLTLDDGAGNSPLLYFITGSDDQIKLLADDTNGDFRILLSETAGVSSLLVEDSGGAQQFAVTSDGDATLSGSLTLPQYIIHDGDTDTYIDFTTDEITIHAGGVDLLTLTEAATDTILFGAQADLNGNDLILDANGDSYLHASADDVIDFVLATAGGELGITINAAEDFTFTANSFNVASGSIIDVNSVVKVRSSGDLTAEADLWMAGNGGISAEGSMTMLIDSDNGSTTAFFEIAADADKREEGVSGISLFGVREDNKAYMRLNGVAHNCTDQVIFTDTFFQVQQVESSGGARILGAKDNAGIAGGAVVLRGLLGEDADTTKTTAGRGIVEIQGYQISGTNVGNVVADGNIVAFRTYVSGAEATRFIFDTEGSAHADVEWTTFDEHDDLALLDALESSFGEFAEEHRPELERLKIATYDDRPGHAMVNWTRLAMLQNGAIRQIGQRLEQYERAFAALGVNPALLEA